MFLLSFHSHTPVSASLVGRVLSPHSLFSRIFPGATQGMGVAQLKPTYQRQNHQSAMSSQQSDVSGAIPGVSSSSCYFV